MPTSTRVSLSAKMRVNVNNTTMSEKLRSAYGVTDSEFAEINEILRLGLKDLDDYDTEIHELQSRILYTNLRKKRLEEHLEKLRSLKAPIRKLPNELLLRIFMFCCNQDELHQGFGRPKLNALAISAVCARWRDLAESSPSLWCSLSVVLSSSEEEFDESEHAIVATLKYYLAHSKDWQLSLDINAGVWWEEAEGIDHPALVLLASQSHRWRDLSFNGPLSVAGSAHLSLASEPLIFSALETLCIDQSDWEDRITDLSLFQHAPRLHTLSLKYTGFDETESNFPWAQITTLDLDTRYANVHRAVVLCPNLKSLRVAVNPIVQIPDAPITSSISSLTLESEKDHEEHDAMLTLIESLTLPSLSDLTFINRVPARFAVGWPGYSIKLLLARSHCTITVLSLCQMSLSDKEAVALLEQVPFVKDLTIHEHRNPASDQDCPLTKALVQSLHGFTRTALHTSCQPLVPHLRSLSLVVREADKFDDLAFVEMISSRWLPHWDPEYAVEVGLACLQSVELVFYNRQEDLTAFSSLMHLEKAGLRIFVAKEKELQRKRYRRCALCS